jgi:hypothetical protein
MPWTPCPERRVGHNLSPQLRAWNLAEEGRLSSSLGQKLPTPGTALISSRPGRITCGRELTALALTIRQHQTHLQAAMASNTVTWTAKGLSVGRASSRARPGVIASSEFCPRHDQSESGPMSRDLFFFVCLSAVAGASS